MPQKHDRQGVWIRSFGRASLVVALAFVAGCSEFGRIRAMQSFKEANQAYGTGDFKKAATLYEDTIKADPNLNYAYFFLGSSYDNT